MAVDTTIPNSSNNVGNDLSAIRENFELLASAQVVDEGSTSDGEYIRFENGLQICWGYKLGDIDTSDTFVWQEISDYPASFDSVVFMALSPIRGEESYEALIELMNNFVFNEGRKTFQWRINYRGSDNGILTEVALLAIGRWK